MPCLFLPPGRPTRPLLPVSHRPPRFPVPTLLRARRRSSTTNEGSGDCCSGVPRTTLTLVDPFSPQGRTHTHTTTAPPHYLQTLTLWLGDELRERLERSQSKGPTKLEEKWAGAGGDSKVSRGLPSGDKGGLTRQSTGSTTGNLGPYKGRSHGFPSTERCKVSRITRSLGRSRTTDHLPVFVLCSYWCVGLSNVPGVNVGRVGERTYCLLLTRFFPVSVNRRDCRVSAPRAGVSAPKPESECRSVETKYQGTKRYD